MSQTKKFRGYWGSYLFGVLLLLVVIIRTAILYAGQSDLIFALIALGMFALLYLLEPTISRRVRWPWNIYFAIQTGLILVLGSFRPSLDMVGALYVPLSVLTVRALSRKAAIIWNILFIVLLSGPMILSLGLVFGLVLSMLITAIGIFMVSYDVLYAQAKTDQAESQVHLQELQSAHQKLQEFASQAEELVAASERNRLARELHDSVGQAIFSATLSARSAQMLIEKDPSQVSGQLERLQDVTSTALTQLRSLITQMRPQ